MWREPCDFACPRGKRAEVVDFLGSWRTTLRRSPKVQSGFCPSTSSADSSGPGRAYCPDDQAPRSTFLHRSEQKGRKRFSGVHSMNVPQVGHLTLAIMARVRSTEVQNYKPGATQSQHALRALHTSDPLAVIDCIGLARTARPSRTAVDGDLRRLGS